MAISVGVAGRGIGARLHLPILIEMGNCSPVPLTVPRVQPYSRRTCRPSSTAWPAIRLAVLATPTFAHVPHLRYALDRTEFILCEKPAGVMVSDPKFLLSLESAADRVLVNYQLRFDPLLQELRTEHQLESSDKVSIIYESNSHTVMPPPWWYCDPSLGGGLLLSLVSHLVDLLHFLHADIRSVRARTQDDGDMPTEHQHLSGAVPNGGRNRIRVEARLNHGRSADIVVDTTAQVARFSIGLRRGGQTEWHDLLGGSRALTPPAYPVLTDEAHPTLSSYGERPWRDAQRRLYMHLLGAPSVAGDPARLGDALRVHEVLSACTRSLGEGGVWCAVRSGDGPSPARRSSAPVFFENG